MIPSPTEGPADEPNSGTQPRSRSWLQDTLKRKLADFSICFVRPPVPVSPGSPELTQRLIETSAPDKKIGLIKKR